MLKDVGVDGIYVVHAIKGYEHHEKRIQELFLERGMAFEFVTEGDPSLFTKELMDEYFIPNIPLGPGPLSCTLNHILAYRRVVERKNKYAIIFENDPFFLGDFNKGIERIVAEVKARTLNTFIISLENSCLRFPSYWSMKAGQLLYAADTGRFAGAYMIDQQAAQNILSDLKKRKCHNVVDTWHNTLIANGVVKMYWAQPPLIEQGSHNGLMSSTISSKSDSLFRRVQWLIQKSYKMYLRRLFPGDRLLKEES